MSKWDDELEGLKNNLLKYAGKTPNKKRIIYARLDHVSRSGTMRKISLCIIKDNRPLWLCIEVKSSGCGMDMGFHLAYTAYCMAYNDTPARRKRYPYQDYLNFQWM